MELTHFSIEIPVADPADNRWHVLDPFDIILLLPLDAYELVVVEDDPESVL